jgi:hypothetical protein
MHRAVAIAFLLATCASGVAGAQQARMQLPGYGGVAFGSAYHEVQSILAAGAVVGKESGHPDVPDLLTRTRLYETNMIAKYSFLQKGTLSFVDHLQSVTVSWSPRDGTPNSDPVCRATWDRVLTGLKADYGVPDSDQNHLTDPEIPNEIVEFRFADGHAVHAALLYCDVDIIYTSQHA